MEGEWHPNRGQRVLTERLAIYVPRPDVAPVRSCERRGRLSVSRRMRAVGVSVNFDEGDRNSINILLWSIPAGRTSNARGGGMLG